MQDAVEPFTAEVRANFERTNRARMFAEKTTPHATTFTHTYSKANKQV